MPLNKTTLKNDFKQLMTDMRTRTEVSDDEFATRFANMVDTYVKEATIIYTGGLIAPNGGGPVTGVFNSDVT